MSTVTYKNQPAIHKTRGSVPPEGTSHLYKVTKLLWPKEIEAYLNMLLVGKSLHVCCGKSQIGDIRLDLFEKDADVLGDASRLPFTDKSVDTILIDPPYNGKFQ
jgi:hypothetical protein